MKEELWDIIFSENINNFYTHVEWEEMHIWKGKSENNGLKKVCLRKYIFSNINSVVNNGFPYEISILDVNEDAKFHLQLEELFENKNIDNEYRGIELVYFSNIDEAIEMVELLKNKIVEYVNNLI